MAEEQVGKVTISFEGKIDELTKSIETLKATIGKFAQDTEQQTEKTGAAWQEMVKGFLVHDVILAGFEKLKNAVTESVKMADEEAQMFAKLKNIFGEGAEELEEYALAQQKTTLYSKDQILSSVETLAAYGKTKDQILQLMPAIEDYASATGKSLPAAAALVNRALASNNDSLGLVHIGLTGAAGSQERLNSFLEIANERWGGSAKAQAEASSGITQFNNQMKEVQEDMGTHMIPAIKSVTEALQFFGGESSSIGAFLGDTLAFVIRGLTSDVLSLAEAWNHYLKLLALGISLIPGMKERGKEVVAEIDATLKKLDEMQVKITASQMGITTDKNKYLKGKSKDEISPLDTGEDDAKEKAAEEAAKRLQDLKDGLRVAELNNIADSNQKEIDLVINKYDKLRREAQGNAAQIAIINKTQEQELLSTSTKMLAEHDKDEEDAAKKLIDFKSKLRDLEISSMTDKDKKEMAALQKKYDDMRQAADGNKEMLVAINRDEETAITDLTLEQSKKRKEIAQKEAQMKIALGFTVVNQFLSTLSTMAAANKDDAIQRKRIAQVGAVVQGAQAIVYAMANPTPLNLIMAALIGAQVGAQIATIEQQKFGKGGPIMGRSHAGGGVSIEAEGGEYIHQKQTVDYYGVAAMEAINRRMIPKELFASIRGMSITMPHGVAASGGLLTSGTKGAQVSIINFVDPALMNRYMKTNTGKAAMVNFISDNAYEVKKALNI